MKAQNIRLGAFVDENKRYPFDENYRGIINLKEEDIIQIFKNNWFDYYKPVKLNKIWINKFGFDDSDYKKGNLGIKLKNTITFDFIIVEPKIMGEWQDFYVFDLGDNKFVTLKYVHELQNLFFSLTKENLELK